MRTAYKLARRFGGKIVTAGRSKHPKIVGLDASGRQIKMTIPSSPSDNARTAKNVEAQLRRAGFVDQSKAARVKDALVKGSKETVLKPTVKQPVNRQTTFKDFTQKYQPNVQGPKRSELQVQGDHIINTIRAKAKRKTISRAQLDSMNIPQKEKDKLIRQGLVNEGAAMALRAVRSNLLPKIMTGVGAVGTVLQASKADKERRRQLAKDNNLDITKPGDRAKLGRLLKKDTEAKKRAEKGDTRTEKEYRKDKADNNRLIDTTRQQMGQSKAKPGTKERTEIDKKLKDFRDELRDVKDPTVPPTRAKVRVKVGQEVPKPDNTLPKRTGASPQRVRDRRSYEAQQRRNLKENKFRVAAQLMNRIGVRKPSDLTRVVNTIKQQAGDRIIRDLRRPVKPTQKGLELQRRMSRAVDKNKDKFPGLFEALTPEEKKNLKLKYMLDQRNKPVNYLPKDSIKDLMHKKKGMA